MKASLASILMGSFRIIPPCDRVQHKIKIFKKVHSNRGNRKLQIGTIPKISWLDKISRERNRIRKIENGKIGNWRNSQIENIKTRRRIEIQEGYTPKIGTATKMRGRSFLDLCHFITWLWFLVIPRKQRRINGTFAEKSQEGFQNSPIGEVQTLFKKYKVFEIEKISCIQKFENSASKINFWLKYSLS